MELWICRACGVEHAARTEVCAICNDERQWVPEQGQSWVSLRALAEDDARVEILELEPHLYGLTARMDAGIGQQAKLLCTTGGNLLWDPPSFIDDGIVDEVRALGGVAAIVPSHPHMFGVQVEWSRAFNNAPIFVAKADQEWIARDDSAIREWEGQAEVLSGVKINQLGGHFPGNAVARFNAPSDGKGVILAGDTVLVNPDRTSVSFMRSFANRIPLSARVVERIASGLLQLPFERLYDNFGGTLATDASEIVTRSSIRHAAWARGDYDHLT